MPPPNKPATGVDGAISTLGGVTGVAKAKPAEVQWLQTFAQLNTGSISQVKIGGLAPNTIEFSVDQRDIGNLVFPGLTLDNPVNVTYKFLSGSAYWKDEKGKPKNVDLPVDPIDACVSLAYAQVQLAQVVKPITVAADTVLFTPFSPQSGQLFLAIVGLAEVAAQFQGESSFNHDKTFYFAVGVTVG